MPPASSPGAVPPWRASPRARFRPSWSVPMTPSSLATGGTRGRAFLAAVLREVDAAGDLEAISLGGYLTRHSTGEGTGKGTGEIARPAPSSWGEHGYNAAWLTRETGWVYPLLHRAAGELADLVALHLRETGDLEARNRQARILRQAGRSLLLAQASDWPFCIARGTASRLCPVPAARQPGALPPAGRGRARWAPGAGTAGGPRGDGQPVPRSRPDPLRMILGMGVGGHP